MAKPRFQPQAWAKLDPALRRTVDSNPGDDARLAIVIATDWAGGPSSLGPRGGDRETERRTDLARREQAFLESAAPLVEALERAGARAIAGYWINGTVAATVPLRCLEGLALRSDVRQIVLDERHKVTTEEGRAPWR